MSNAKPSSIPADWGVKLLTDLQCFFAKQTAKNYPTEQLLIYLAGIHNAPWTTFDQGKAITARHLARLLQPYGIVPKTIRFNPYGLAKGYHVADFEDAFTRYPTCYGYEVARSVVTDSVVTDDVADKIDVTDDVTDKMPVVTDDVTDNVADNVADNVDDSIDVLDRMPIVAANVADKSGDVAANVADKSGDVAANPLDATRNQLYRLGEHLKLRYEETGHPFSGDSPSDVQQWRDLVNLMRQAADSIESFTISHRPTLTLIQGGVAADVAAVRAADDTAVRAARKPEVAAPVQAKQWPPPKGWVWNHHTGCYEPPKPTVQPDPSVLLQPIERSPHLKYQPGYGLVAIDQ